MVTSALRIYADFNGLVRGCLNPERTAVVLDTFGSLRDLSNAGETRHRKPVPSAEAAAALKAAGDKQRLLVSCARSAGVRFATIAPA